MIPPRRGVGLFALAALAALALAGLPVAVPRRQQEEDPFEVDRTAQRIGRELGLSVQDINGEMLGLLDRGPVTVAGIEARLRAFANSDEKRARDLAKVSPFSIELAREVIALRRKMGRPLDGPLTEGDSAEAEYLFDRAREKATEALRETMRDREKAIEALQEMQRAAEAAWPARSTRASRSYVDADETRAALRASVAAEAKRRSERLADVKLERRRKRDEQIAAAAKRGGR